MLPQNFALGKTYDAFFKVIAALHISALLNAANIKKQRGISAFEIFKFLLLLVFDGKNLFRFLHSNRACSAPASKNTFYRFLENQSANWIKFVTLLAAKVVYAISRLTRKGRVRVLILDDSAVPRNRSKAVELLAKVFDHLSSMVVRGHCLLTLGWSDGYSFIPVAFNLLSSANENSRLTEMKGGIDRRTNAYKIRTDSLMQKPQAAIELVRRALDAGIYADYVLADSWFINEPFIASILPLGIGVIGMVKDIRQRYIYNGKALTLAQMKKLVVYPSASEIFGSLLVKTGKQGLPVKIVFVRNRSNRSECLYIISTDTSLSDREIVRIYGNRWEIEVFFKASKNLLKLGKEFETRDYGAAVAHTAIVFTRYILIECIRRNENDDRAYGGIFYDMCDDVRDIDLAGAVKSLMSLFSEIAKAVSAKITNLIESKLGDWVASQPLFIRCLLANSLWES